MRTPRKHRLASPNRFKRQVRKGTPPPSSCGTQRPGLPRIRTPAVYPCSTPSATMQVGWEDLQASGTMGRSQTAETFPTAPRPLRCGTPLTFTLLRPSAAIDTSLTEDSNLTLLGTYGMGDAGVEIIRCCKTVYVLPHTSYRLLCADLSPVEAWNRLRGAIIDAAEEDACRPLIDWIHAVIIRSGSNTHSALIVPEPSAPLPDALLLQNCHRFLLSHLPGPDLSINRAGGTRIAEMVGEVAVELRETRLENKQVREKKYNKGATEYFGANLEHLLNLLQVTN